MENLSALLDIAIKEEIINLNQAMRLIKLAENKYKRHDLLSTDLISTGNPIEDVLTLKEAENLWMKDRTTLTKNIKCGKYLPGEIRKSKGTWLITAFAMRRLYGDMVIKQQEENNEVER